MLSIDTPAALWLVRHGESAGNVALERAHAGDLERIEIEARRDTDVPLSALGEEQAAAFGRWLRTQPRGAQPTVALASPYVRARRTAELALAEAGLGSVKLIICHSVVVLCFRYLLERMTEEQILAVDHACDVANCSLTAFELSEERLALQRFNFVVPLQSQGTEVTREPDVALKPK